MSTREIYAFPTTLSILRKYAKKALCTMTPLSRGVTGKTFTDTEKNKKKKKTKNKKTTKSKTDSDWVCHCSGNPVKNVTIPNKRLPVAYTLFRRIFSRLPLSSQYFSGLSSFNSVVRSPQFTFRDSISGLRGSDQYWKLEAQFWTSFGYLKP